MRHPAIDPILDGDDYVPATEMRLEASMGLDSMSTLDILNLLAAEDRAAVDAVARATGELAELVIVAADRIRNGGSVHYFGAGTSGRLAVLDAAELLPTYNLQPGVVVAHMAGGPAALVNSVENVEDSLDNGRDAARDVGSNDVAIGLTASGSTPYVGGALTEARARGAYTALISSNSRAPLASLADTVVLLDTGPEVITGSTRLKAGTAEKLALNGFSTALMIALGRTWSNLMVSVVASNDKLRRRTVRILMQAAEITEAESQSRLADADGELKVAIIAAIAGVNTDSARAALRRNSESVRDALAQLAPVSP